MAAKSTNELESEAGTDSSYDIISEFKAFDDSKIGVQGLVENGVSKVPPFFYYQLSNPNDSLTSESNYEQSFPVIDLTGIHDDPILRGEVLRNVRSACENWGFFHIINHGIPTQVLDEMIKGVRSFHEQDVKVRKEYYTRDKSKKVIYVSNYNFYQSADWRDTLTIFWAPNPPQAEELPAVCRDIVIEYSTKVMALGSTLFELLSESLGLNRFYFKEMGSDEGLLHRCHHYPACPEPELTIGAKEHADGDLMTILLQDQLGGLQVLHDNEWVHVPPLHGALIVNVGDLLQLMTNDKFISAKHRVLANDIGPRMSVASFFRTDDRLQEGISKVFAPIKELLSKDNPPIYREISLKEYLTSRYHEGNRTSSLSHFKL